MKAIQIKYFPVTNTKSSRLKAYTEAGQLIEEINHQYDIAHHAIELARRYIKKMGWTNEISGFGTLPNGDYVATLEEKETQTHKDCDRCGEGNLTSEQNCPDCEQPYN